MKNSTVLSTTLLLALATTAAAIAVGYPPTHRTPTLESPVWHHWQSRAGRYEVRWDDKGTVREIVGQK